ncbi:MAG: alpha/beta hydrolase, partial [Myxococcota bacterium]
VDASAPQPDAGFSDPATLQKGIELIGGVRMYTHVRGTLTSTMPTVVFVNTGPFLGNEYLLAPMAFLLGSSVQNPDRLHVYFDLRATGRSGFTATATAAITLDGHLNDLAAVIDWTRDEWGRTGPVDIVGHGYGASLAALYAAEHSDRVSRLVLVTPHPVDVQQHAEWYSEWNSRLNTPQRERLQAILRPENCLRNVPQCSFDYWTIIGPGWLCPENEQIFSTMTFEHVEMRAYWSRGFINEDLRARQFDWRSDIARVVNPTTIIAGTCDPIPAEAAQVYTSNIEGARLHVFEDAGHFPFAESPAQFQRIMKAALAY